ncbi:MAG: hypothetical protein CSA65_08915 [Proteobacteria bacterium]|nr:MAG: hypothetical protein CSB49_01740 [Pseudomonadota bacterium]PIE17456.1 MAG: hypothetical protein CSA65_08915 [Pseudomonadota bacterium]
MRDLSIGTIALSVAIVLSTTPTQAEARDSDQQLRTRLVAAAPAVTKQAGAKREAKVTKPAPAKSTPAPPTPAKPTPTPPTKPVVASAKGDKDRINDPIPTLDAEAPRGRALKTIELPKDTAPPFYERGWFWPVVGGIAAAIIVAIVVAESVGGDDRMPLPSTAR